MDTPTAQADITTIKRRSFGFYRNSTFVSLLIGYIGYYLCRQNFSVAYGPMKDSLGIDAVTFGMISSIGTLVYAIGKVTTGALADTHGGRSLFFVGLAGSVLASIAFGFGSTISMFIVFWSLLRYFQSMGWGGLVNVMSRWFSNKNYGTAMGLMSINYQFGSVIASVFAGAILSFGFSWRAVFWIPAIVLALIGIAIWPFLINCPKDVGYEQPAHHGTETALTEDFGKKLSYRKRFQVIFKDPMFLVMCALSFVLTLLRECFSLWMPAYFSDMGASSSAAAFKSAVFPLLGCIGTLFAGWFSDKFLHGRRAPVMGALMTGLAISLLGLGHLDFISSFTQISRSTLSVVLVAISGFLLLGPYSLVGGVVALDFGGRQTAGTAAGILDGVGYLGATLAGYGVASVVVSYGWAKAYSLMSILCLVGVVLCGWLWHVKPKGEMSSEK